jgi:ABC-type transport system involved in multi-copper enzyme maturation permease subunit
MTMSTELVQYQRESAVVRQTWAILLDAYRELNSKRMFWFVLVLSGIAIAAFAVVGVGPYGLTIAGYDSESSFVPAKSQYKWLFSSTMIDWWLTWGVLILAIISTAGIFPDFLAGGSVDLFIAKPISRLRLFLTKYFAGMLFAFLQVTCFAIVAFFVVGIRGKMWDWRLFLAIPIVLCLFSYLYAVAVLFGVMTRSTIATLLLTILMWGIIGGIHFGEVRLLAFKHVDERRLERINQQIVDLDKAKPTTRAVVSSSALKSVAEMLGVHVGRPSSPQRDQLVTRRDDVAGWVAFLTKWHKITYPLHVILPKTSDTADLLEQALIPQDEFTELMSGKQEEMQQRFRGRVRDEEIFTVPEEIDQIRRSRSTQSIVGSSLVFEAAVLGVAAWMFCRKDF